MSVTEQHEQAFELLPWFANGTLRPDERAFVERHIRECLSCRAELKAQRHLNALVREHPIVHLSPEQSLSAVLKNIERIAPRTRLAWLRAPLHSPFATSRLTAIAATLVIAVLGAITWTQMQRGSAENGAFETLTDARTSVGARAVQIDIVLAQGVSERDLRALLASIDGNIVDGPSDLGRYTVAIAQGRAATPAEIGALLERLRHDPRVQFAATHLMPDAGTQ